ncbi:MAG: DUF4268 domain-containing protein [Flavisolibacter sp.]
MYSRQQASQLRKEFWTAFGQYMAPVVSSEGERINWINYKTGVKDVYIKLGANHKMISVSLQFAQKDPEMQQLFFDHLRSLETVLAENIKNEWVWRLHTYDENGKLISGIFSEKEHLSILKKEDWPEIISFFKPRIMGLDRFWNNVKYAFQPL